MWHEELRHDHKEFLELFMSTYNCTRTEAKAQTFGIRYGQQTSLHDWSKAVLGKSGDIVYIDDLSSLERRISGSIIDNILGPKDL